jgi:hypothetical protein
MSDELIKSLTKWGLPSVLWRKTRKLRNKTFQAPFGIDRAENCSLGPNYWSSYPIRDFDYKFNSWGFRGEDYEQYRKENTNQKVNVCVGDSFTLNIGGPIEHSWPHLLSKYFDQPTVNISIDGMSSYYYQSGVDKCKQLFNVDKIFVLYNLFDDAPLNSDLSRQLLSPASNTVQKLLFLKKHCWIHDAHWQFIPPWAFVNDDAKYLQSQLPDAHDYLKNIVVSNQDVDINVLLAIEPLKLKYAEYAGGDWIPYEKFCELVLSNANVFQFFDSEFDRKLVQEFITDHFSVAIKKVLVCSRDGVHMNKKINQALADYFYQQSCLVKLR